MMPRSLLKDARWAERGGRDSVKIALTTFGILALELALIRWTSAQVRVFAYFNNIVLIAAFLGMGLGVALGRQRPGLVHLVLPALLLLAVPLAFSEGLALVHLPFPDQSIALWGGEISRASPLVFAQSLIIFLLLLGGIVAVFACAGAPLGYLFGRLEPLRAYTADLTGSLLGIAAFALAAWLEAGPGVWLALGAAPFVWLSGRAGTLVLGLLVVALGQYSEQGALFSPYNRIVLTQVSPQFLELQVNRDYHQNLHDLSNARLSKPTLADGRWLYLVQLRNLYDLPFTVNPRRGTALVVGAGTGNDVQAALRHGYAKVTGVDIDGRIIALGAAHHPEQPYADPRVIPVTDDARAFFQKNTGQKFDVVCYGLLDSHAMASAMSTLRLDNYVYTEEGIRAAWERVAPGGHLSLAMCVYSGQWFFERLFWTVTKATGHEPVALSSPINGGTVTFLVPRDGVTLDETVLARHPRVFPERTMRQTLTPSDDWPFLYIRPGVFPWGYLLVLGFILLLAGSLCRSPSGCAGNRRRGPTGPCS